MVNTNTFAPAGQTNSYFGLPTPDRRSHIVIAGAGAFGGWTALYLLRKGFKVTVVDPFGPGNARSSSGDETRVIRSTYGGNKTYFDMNVRALALWKENQDKFQKKLFFDTGVLWLCYQEKTPLVDDSLPFSEEHQLPYEYLTQTDLKKRYPLINTTDLHHAYYDPHGGYLKARESCQAVAEAFLNEGGNFIQAQAKPGAIKAGRMESISLANNIDLKADAFIFACGAWLGNIFPEVLGSLIIPTKQEVYYWGIPPKHASEFDNLPVWVDVDNENFYYGICNNAHRGFKIGVDKRGENFDPTFSERLINYENLNNARKFLEHRFPKLKDMPLVESRVCPYENTPDGNFIIDTHPEAENLFFLGGGSGHGFKHGPAIGELMAKALTGEREIPMIFSLKRF